MKPSNSSFRSYHGIWPFYTVGEVTGSITQAKGHATDLNRLVVISGDNGILLCDMPRSSSKMKSSSSYGVKKEGE
ncbi:hypothetical protein Tco_1328395 [Tanacetum coccineum]